MHPSALVPGGEATCRIIADGSTISVESLNELASDTRRKMRMSWPVAHSLLSMIHALFPVHPITVEMREIGVTLIERYCLSVYDAMIAASTLHAECDTHWSEDMHDGIVIQDRLRIANPFCARCRPWLGLLGTPEVRLSELRAPDPQNLTDLAPPRSLPPPTPT